MPKFSVALFILQLIARASLERIISNSSKLEASSNLVETTVKILKSCYQSRLSIVGVAGKSTNYVSSLLMSEEKFAVILLKENSRSKYDVRSTQSIPYKPQIIVITISTSIELKEILNDIKKSWWWNHMVQYYITHQTINEEGCSGAYEILSTAWRMNLLEAKFICASSRERLIYGFNPYTSDAPKPWRLENIYRGENDHPWSLLVREYHDDEEICDNMDFDKTKNLGGYVIRCAMPRAFKAIKESARFNETDLKPQLRRYSVAVAQSFHRAINVTIKYRTPQRNETTGYFNYRNLAANGLLKTTIDGITDIDLASRNIGPERGISFAYAHASNGLFILTQYSGDKSQLQKIISVLDLSSRIGVCIVFLVNLIIFKFCVGQTSSTAILNIIRLMCNSAITNIPKKSALRICLSVLFIFIVTITGIYQGQMASILSRREPLKNINKLQDLAESDHTIYSRDQYNSIFDGLIANERHVAITENNCSINVLQDPLAACMVPRSQLVIDAARYKLHLSSSAVLITPAAFVIRKDWPLKRRINKHIQRLFEAKLIQRWQESDFKKPLLVIEKNENENKDRNRKIFTLEDMAFAFAILGIGLALATISFFVELIIDRRSRSRKSLSPVASRDRFVFMNFRVWSYLYNIVK